MFKKAVWVRYDWEGIRPDADQVDITQMLSSPVLLREFFYVHPVCKPTK